MRQPRRQLLVDFSNICKVYSGYGHPRPPRLQNMIQVIQVSDRCPHYVSEKLHQNPRLATSIFSEPRNSPHVCCLKLNLHQNDSSFWWLDSNFYWTGQTVTMFEFPKVELVLFNKLPAFLTYVMSSLETQLERFILMQMWRFAGFSTWYFTPVSGL